MGEHQEGRSQGTHEAPWLGWEDGSARPRPDTVTTQCVRVLTHAVGLVGKQVFPDGPHPCATQPLSQGVDEKAKRYRRG